VGVDRYLIVRDDGVVGESVVPAFADDDPPPGKRTYAVYAADAAGNYSAPGVATVRVGPGGRGARPARPRLDWRRGDRGRLVFVVRAAPGSEAKRLELWIQGRRLGSTRARRLRVSVRPRASWPRRIRVVAVAVGPDGKARLTRMVRRPTGGESR
jgi:hypothetical protein